MPDSLYALALLACPLGMGAMMWMMMRKDHSPPASDTQAKQAELAHESSAVGPGQQRRLLHC